MLTDQRTRHELFKRFEELLGPELAGAYMELHPPIDWTQLATKADLALLEASTQAEMSAIRGDLRDVEASLHGVEASLRGDLRDAETRLRGGLQMLAIATRGGLYALLAETRGQFAGLRIEMGTLRSDFSAELERTVREALTSQSRHMVLTISAMMLSLMGMMLTLVGLLSGWFPR